MSTASPVDFSDTEVVREYAISKDGTRVPLNILRRKGTRLDHSNPTLLVGYGGYGINLQPFFSPLNRVWLGHGSSSTATPATRSWP
jgi:prolyl oligopeptidase